MDKYFENLNFSKGKKINLSKKIDVNFLGREAIHWHQFVEIFVSLHGNSKAIINFTEYELLMNDMVIIYPGDLHTFEYVEEDGYILIQFPLELLTILGDFNSYLPVFYQYLYVKYDPSNDRIKSMLSRINEIEKLYNNTDELFSEARMYAILLEFFSEYGAYCLGDKKKTFMEKGDAEKKSVKLMAEACLYISENCTNPLTLEDVASHVGFDKYYFSHLFKTYTNMTFWDFLMAERVKNAEILLLNPKMRMIDIAFTSGFSSVSSFNRAFKKIKGMSPSKFKEVRIKE